jgi:hypothetical protein
VKLLGASQAAHVRAAAVALNDSRKACTWNESDDLRKQGLADIHGKSPRGLSLENYTGKGKQVLNRNQKKSAARARQEWLSLQIKPV